MESLSLRMHTPEVSFGFFENKFFLNLNPLMPGGNKKVIHT